MKKIQYEAAASIPPKPNRAIPGHPAKGAAPETSLASSQASDAAPETSLAPSQSSDVDGTSTPPQPDHADVAADDWAEYV